MELDILRSFGWAVIELESVLFERYTHLSAANSLITFDAFRKALHTMESRGLLSSYKLNGLPAYRKLVVDKRVIDEVSPQSPNDEMRLALSGMKASMRDRPARPATTAWELMRASGSEPKRQTSETSKGPSVAPAQVTAELVRQSEKTGEEIIAGLKKVMQRRPLHARMNQRIIAMHVRNMRDSLAVSEEAFLKYVQTETPELLDPLRKILVRQGPEYLLLSLRMVDSKVRKYLQEDAPLS
jgi:hypothetical protein